MTCLGYSTVSAQLSPQLFIPWQKVDNFHALSRHLSCSFLDSCYVPAISCDAVTREDIFYVLMFFITLTQATPLVLLRYGIPVIFLLFLKKKKKKEGPCPLYQLCMYLKDVFQCNLCFISRHHWFNLERPAEVLPGFARKIFKCNFCASDIKSWV